MPAAQTHNQENGVQKMGCRILSLFLGIALLFLIVLEFSIGCEPFSSVFGIIYCSIILLLLLIAAFCKVHDRDGLYQFILITEVIFGTIRLGFIVGYAFRMKEYAMGRMLADRCYGAPFGLLAIDTTIVGLLVWVCLILQQ